ncbi:MAG: hypothetical protein IPK16_31400 [Anaerolineales bacterium]|nr:hypothetical protein [Anaerolineales bacterium]
MFSAAKNLTDAAKQAAPNELMGAIFSTFSSQDAMKQAEPKYDTKDPYALRQAILASIHGAVEVLDQKAAPEEAKAFKDWLYQFGVQQANAAKEGGFMGIGAVRVSEAEKTALVELADALGITPVVDPAPAAPADSAPAAPADSASPAQA